MIVKIRFAALISYRKGAAFKEETKGHPVKLQPVLHYFPVEKADPSVECRGVGSGADLAEEQVRVPMDKFKADLSFHSEYFFLAGERVLHDWKACFPRPCNDIYLWTQRSFGS